MAIVIIYLQGKEGANNISLGRDTRIQWVLFLEFSWKDVKGG